MASKKRLKRGITDLFANIEANKSLESLIPTSVPEETGDETPGLPDDFRLIPGEREYRRTEYDTSPEFVEDAKPPKYNYGQGPSRSTRVAVHKFVPNLMERAGVTTPQSMGTVYVKFQPHMNGSHANDIWKYKNVPESVYQSFANNNSKGRFIREVLDIYPKGRISTREDRRNTQDF